MENPEKESPKDLKVRLLDSGYNEKMFEALMSAKELVEAEYPDELEETLLRVQKWKEKDPDNMLDDELVHLVAVIDVASKKGILKPTEANLLTARIPRD